MFGKNQGNDSNFEDLLENVTLDSGSDNNKIIIRDKQARRKVRRRVKKGTKQDVLARRQSLSEAKTITIVEDDKDDDFDFNVLGSNHRIEREYKKPEKKAEKIKASKKNKDKYEDLGMVEASDFRVNSKKWQDEEYTDYVETSVKEENAGIGSMLAGISPLQWIAAIVAVIIFGTAVFGTTVYAKNNAAINRANAMKRLASFEMTDGEYIASMVESIEEPLVFEEAPEETHKILSLVLSSVEKDLKIKLIDEEDLLVKNLPWSVTLTDDKGAESIEEDDDEDGIIHLTDVSAGEYSVVLNPSDELSEYDFSRAGQSVSVKAKVEYKVIQDIKREIKTEKEVNAAVEDANGNQAADVETGPVVVDTVEWCESTKEAAGEAYVEATPDISKTASLIKENRFLAVLDNLKKSANTLIFENGNLANRVMYLSAEISEGEKTEQNSSSSDAKSTVSENIISCDKHDFAYTSNEDGSHTAKCKVCGEKVTEKCTLSEGKCIYCGYQPNTSNYSDEAQLYDASKNALYVYEDGLYRLAKYKDYRTGAFSTFYRKTDSYLYTGWQTIEGRRFYYRSDHTYVTGDQIIGGVSYSFGSDGALASGTGTLGIDVSKYQPSINWASVKASGVNFVIIRCGYRGSSTGVLIEDPYFRSHIKGAKAAGLKVGVYFFTTAVNEAEAVEEASMCAYLCSGYGIDYPVFIDCESSNRAGYNGMSAGQRTEIIKAFCNTIRSAGYTPGVYANKTWLSSYMNVGSLSGCKIWLAQYNSAGPTYSGRYDIWQYTSKGSVAGISGNVDMNQSYLGY